MKRILASELAGFIGVSEKEVLQEARNILKHYYLFYIEKIKGHGVKMLLTWDDALAICDIFGKDPKKIGLAKHTRFYNLELEDMPVEIINEKAYIESDELRKYLQASFETNTWVRLKNRTTKISLGEDYIIHKNRYYFTKDGSLKMCSPKHGKIRKIIEQAFRQHTQRLLDCADN